MNTITVTEKSIGTPIGPVVRHEASITTHDGVVTATGSTPAAAVEFLRAKLEVILLAHRLDLMPAADVAPEPTTDQGADATLKQLRHSMGVAEDFLLGSRD